MRVVETMTCAPLPSGVAPPLMPVLPPCVTMGVWAFMADAHHGGRLFGARRAAPRPARGRCHLPSQSFT
jgi:hypothetical protein